MACSARSADSRPEPGPETSTSNVRMPCSTALRPASSAAICAAYGVDLREPLKPIMPADDQEMALPCASVMVTVVLLKVAATWATPTATFFFSFLRARPAPFLSATAMLLGHFLLAGDGLGRPLAGAGVGMGALATDGQALAVAQAPIAAQIHQALDVHGDVAAQIAFHQIVAVDDFANLDDLGLGQIADAAGRIDAQLADDLVGGVRPDSMDIAKADFDSLLGRDIDAGDACHSVFSGAVKPLNGLIKFCTPKVRPNRGLGGDERRPKKPGNDRKICREGPDYRNLPPSVN